MGDSSIVDPVSSSFESRSKSKVVRALVSSIGSLTNSIKDSRSGVSNASVRSASALGKEHVTSKIWPSKQSRGFSDGLLRSD